jgi:hypothetical protein
MKQITATHGVLSYQHLKGPRCWSIAGMRKEGHVEHNVAVSLAGPLPPESLEILARHGWTHNSYD